MLTRENFGHIFMARVYAAREIAARRAVAAPPVASTAGEPPPTFQSAPTTPKPRPQPPVESAEQAAARFAGTIVAVIDELVSQGLERSDAVDIGSNTAYALGHVMATRLCPP